MFSEEKGWESSDSRMLTEKHREVEANELEGRLESRIGSGGKYMKIWTSAF